MFGSSGKQSHKMDAFVPQSFEDQIYSAVVNSGDVCFDIGANEGDITLLMAKLAGKCGTVIAFEPVFQPYTRLCSKIQKYASQGGLIITVPYGMAEYESAATIQVPDGIFAMGSMAGSDEWSKAQNRVNIESHECRFITLDVFIHSFYHVIPDLIKIDVEGAELYVIRGGCKFFADGSRPLMIIEVFAPWERAFGYGPWDLFLLLIDLGYRFLFACPEGLVEYEPTASKPFPSEYSHGYNVLAYCPDKHSERIKNVEGLRIGKSNQILAMLPPPVANKIAQ
jgi:FkbM family methyltransferase